MTKENLCQKVNIPFPIKNIDLDYYRNLNKSQILLDKKHINKDFINLMTEKYRAEIYFIELFYLPAYSSHIIHCDGHELDDKGKINFIIGGKESRMIWYVPKEKKFIETGYTKANTKYLRIKESNADEIYKEHLDAAHIVNVGRFHTAKTEGHERFCISLALLDIYDKRRLKFNELKERI